MVWATVQTVFLIGISVGFGEFERFRRIFTNFKKYYQNSLKHTKHE
jgi:hypothetical protein